jgi:hypothetical protein
MFRCLFFLFSILAAIVAASPALRATPEYAQKEDKKCEFCHTAVGKPDLNGAGKYYKEHHTLEGYEPKPRP